MDRIHEVQIVQNKNLLQDTCGSGSAERRSKQLPDLILDGLKCGPACQKAAQKKEKEEWAMEKPKLDNRSKTERRLFFFEKPKVDNARRLRGIYFIDPEDGEREKKP